MNERKEKSDAAFIFAVLSAVFLLIAGAGYMFVPEIQKLIIFQSAFFESFRSTPAPYFVFWGGMFVHAVFMIGVINSMRSVNRAFTDAYFSWVSILGIVGYSVMALTYISRMDYIPRMTNAFLEGSAATQETIVSMETMEFDSFVMSYGFAALWFVSFGLYAIRHRIAHAGIAFVSFVIGLGYLLGLIGYLVGNAVLTTMTAAVVFIFPLWTLLNIFHFKQGRSSEKMTHARRADSKT